MIAIELLNEPFPGNEEEGNFLRSFYHSAYRAVRQVSPMVVAIDEAFQGLQTWQGFMSEPEYHDVAMDTHVYAMFNNYTLVKGYSDNLLWTCEQAENLQLSDRSHWTIVGEFTRKACKKLEFLLQPHTPIARGGSTGEGVVPAGTTRSPELTLCYSPATVAKRLVQIPANGTKIMCGIWASPLNGRRRCMSRL